MKNRLAGLDVVQIAVGAASGTRLTETGLSVGTPCCMSPEQATGDVVVGPPTDVYALVLR